MGSRAGRQRARGRTGGLRWLRPSQILVAVRFSKGCFRGPYRLLRSSSCGHCFRCFSRPSWSGLAWCFGCLGLGDLSCLAVQSASDLRHLAVCNLVRADGGSYSEYLQEVPLKNSAGLEQSDRIRSYGSHNKLKIFINLGIKAFYIHYSGRNMLFRGIKHAVIDVASIIIYAIYNNDHKNERKDE